MQNLFISILLVVGTSSLSFAASLFFFKKKMQSDASKALEARIAQNEKAIELVSQQVALIGQTVQPISTAFQSILIKQLTHEHAPLLDELLEKIGPPNILTDEQNVELLLELKKRSHDPSVDSSERAAAKMLPLVMDRVKAESEKEGEESQHDAA